MSENGENGNVGVKSVVVTFKCTEKFKLSLDKFVVSSTSFDNRSDMIRQSIRLSMLEMGFGVNEG